MIYAPAFYADTDELVELCKVAAEYQGMYISHMRSEGNRLVEAVEELIHISSEAGLPAEIYHLKAGGQENWPKRARVVELVEAARAGRHADHGRHVRLHGRFDGAQRLDASVGARGGPGQVDRAAARP